jgi:hypothetical protein
MTSDKSLIRTALLASLCMGILAASAHSSAATAQGGQQAATVQPEPHKASRYRPVSVTSSAKLYYQTMWGVDKLLVQRTASDNLIRFSYHVTDPVRARILNDKQAEPLLYNSRTRAVLHIPVMEKVGPLRQTFTPEAGKDYWMAFSNKGNLVRAGDRVSVVIGGFHADGLLVE